jgi:hypothetical protein
MDFPTTTTIAVAEVPVRTRVYVAAYAYARARTTAECEWYIPPVIFTAEVDRRRLYIIGK